MDKREVVKLAETYADKITNIVNPDKVVLYGSYAKDAAHSDSDIDIAVICNHFNGDRFKISTELWKCAYGVSDIIEPVLLSDDDDVSGFLNEVLNTGIVVYDSETLKETA